MVFIMALLLSADASGGAAIPSDGANCELSAPPANAGDVIGDEPEFDLKVFPRYKDFPHRYTGCQTSWFNMRNQWQRIAIAYFERGKPVAFIAYAAAVGKKEDLVCRYRGRRVIGGPDDECPDPPAIVLKSMPAGCAQLIRSGKPKPEDCRDD